MAKNLVQEKKSSAFTMSDMEIFIFPELFYSLVLANIMSPVIWRWRENTWFKNIENKSFNYRINRVKQFIIDKTVFNLDLDTWGLTTKERELERFSSFIDSDALSQSNALFGYEGDKYYFSIDIRRHFGLEKYSDNVIPYWKTETVEAMDAFKHKNEVGLAAGECVSFSALYAAAMFIIGKIPLEKIYLIATPLHSQNFIDENEGFITNNRRIVTKKMWYNGTELSAKARRAIENEKITIVSHISGYIHTLYQRATINPVVYQQFSESFRKYLKTDFSFEVFINYLKTKPEYWNCFEYEIIRNGKKCFIDLHTVFNYERSSKNTIANESRTALFTEIDAHDFNFSQNEKKLLINDFERFLNENQKISFEEIKNYFFDKVLGKECEKMLTLFEEMESFIKIDPKLPPKEKDYELHPTLNISINDSREDIIQHIISMREKNEMAQYALYAYRKMDLIDWNPFIQAAIERNPVCLEDLKNTSIMNAYNQLISFSNESIYEENRLALPDEVWNFKCGDGLEKAFVLLNLIKSRNEETVKSFSIDNGTVILLTDKKAYHFESKKNISKQII